MKIKYIISSILFIVLFFISFNFFKAKETLSEYYSFVNNLQFKKANEMLIYKKRFITIPENVKDILKIITTKGEYDISFVRMYNVNKFEFKVKEKTPLVFEIITNFKKISNTNLNNFDLDLFKSFSRDLLKNSEYYELKENNYILIKDNSIWKIIIL